MTSHTVSSTLGAARAGTLTTPHGDVPTPAFMPVGTRGTVRGLLPDECRAAGAHMLLANAYHLWVRPGHATVAALGGLHRFMGWNGPLLTDSGGFQAFSMREHRKVTEEGVRFRSPEDGRWRMLTPEVAVEVQEALGVDVAMALDECIEANAPRERVVASTERTTRWLHRCLAARQRPKDTALWGIVQGGTFGELRSAHAETLHALDLDGYAIGGLSVGEDRASCREMVEASTAVLPSNKIRYLMGVGTPPDVYDAIHRGVDLFDCVAPTRAGRHGQAWTPTGRRNMRNARYILDPAPLDDTCIGPCCGVSRAYLRHLVQCDELLGKRLLSEHNLRHLFRVVQRARDAIERGDGPAFTRLGEEVHAGWAPASAEK